MFITNAVMANDNSSPIKIDNDELIKLTNSYFNLLQKTINQKLNNYMAIMEECFKDPAVNDHVYDLSDKRDSEFVFAYLSDAQKATKIKEIVLEIEDIELLGCVYFDPITSQQYTYIKVQKTLHWDGPPNKTNYAHYLAINVSNQNYKIEEVYEDSATTESKYIAPCLKTELNLQKQKELTEQIEVLYNEVTQLYSEKEYLTALTITESILELNPQHQNAIDAKEALLKFIDNQFVSEQIQKNLEQGNIAIADDMLQKAIEYNLGDQASLVQWKSAIEKEKKERNQEIKYQKAEYYFANEMYQQALPIFQQLQREGYNNKELVNRLNVCLEQDPELIQKRIQKAYDAAVASSKNYESTFNTYYKYENSGYLKGTNYQFMCLMMIDKNNKKLLRNLGMSGNQAKNLAVKYFYKAREMGVNTRDIEILVFTKNFNKIRKN